MVTSTPNKIIDFEDASDSVSSVQALREKGRDYLDATLSAAQENPWKAAAIGAGVVATVAATAFGATLIAKRTANGSEDTAGDGIDPDSLPQAVNLD